MKRRKMGTDEWRDEVAQLMVALQQRTGATETYQGIRPRSEHGNVPENEEEQDKAA